MTPFWSFVLGAISIGIILAIWLGALLLDTEEEANKKEMEEVK